MNNHKTHQNFNWSENKHVCQKKETLVKYPGLKIVISMIKVALYGCVNKF